MRGLATGIYGGDQLGLKDLISGGSTSIIRRAKTGANRMSNYVPLDEAAKRLGVNPDQLVEMLSRGDIFGYRDGASWKFKPERSSAYSKRWLAI